MGFSKLFSIFIYTFSNLKFDYSLHKIEIVGVNHSALFSFSGSIIFGFIFLHIVVSVLTLVTQNQVKI